MTVSGRKWHALAAASVAALAAAVALAAPTPAPVLEVEPMTFKTEALTDTNAALSMMGRNGARRIWARGALTEGTTERFLAFVEANRIAKGYVYLDSPGGSMAEGIELGRALRSLGFSTDVGGEDDKGGKSLASCLSACAYAYAGGLNRFLRPGSGRLGLHQFSSDDGSANEREVQLAAGAIVEYLDEMDVDAKAFTVASYAPSDGITWLTIDQAEKLGLANQGVLPTTAEIKLAEMRPHLQLEQEHFDVTTRLIFSCQDRRLVMIAGIVTNPEDSQIHVAMLDRAYIEIDGVEALAESGPEAAEADNDVVWLPRDIADETARALLKADRIDIWVDLKGGIRWGGPMELKGVRPQIASYFDQCAAQGAARAEGAGRGR